MHLSEHSRIFYDAIEELSKEIHNGKSTNHLLRIIRANNIFLHNTSMSMILLGMNTCNTRTQNYPRTFHFDGHSELYYFLRTSDWGLSFSVTYGDDDLVFFEATEQKSFIDAIFRLTAIAHSCCIGPFEKGVYS